MFDEVDITAFKMNLMAIFDIERSVRLFERKKSLHKNSEFHNEKSDENPHYGKKIEKKDLEYLVSFVINSIKIFLLPGNTQKQRKIKLSTKNIRNIFFAFLSRIKFLPQPNGQNSVFPNFF